MIFDLHTSVSPRGAVAILNAINGRKDVLVISEGLFRYDSRHTMLICREHRGDPVHFIPANGYARAEYSDKNNLLKLVFRRATVLIPVENEVENEE